MPGLLRGMARTAVVAGTGAAVSTGVSRRQSGRGARQEECGQGYDEGSPAPPAHAPAQAAPAARSSINETLSQLKGLGELRDRGLLSEAEFDSQKRKVLAS